MMAITEEEELEKDQEEEKRKQTWKKKNKSMKSIRKVEICKTRKKKVEGKGNSVDSPYAPFFTYKWKNEKKNCMIPKN